MRRGAEENGRPLDLRRSGREMGVRMTLCHLHIYETPSKLGRSTKVSCRKRFAARRSENEALYKTMADLYGTAPPWARVAF